VVPSRDPVVAVADGTFCGKSKLACENNNGSNNLVSSGLRRGEILPPSPSLRGGGGRGELISPRGVRRPTNNGVETPPTTYDGRDNVSGRCGGGRIGAGVYSTSGDGGTGGGGRTVVYQTGGGDGGTEGAAGRSDSTFDDSLSLPSSGSRVSMTTSSRSSGSSIKSVGEGSSGVGGGGGVDGVHHSAEVSECEVS